MDVNSNHDFNYRVNHFLLNKLNRRVGNEKFTQLDVVNCLVDRPGTFRIFSQLECWFGGKGWINKDRISKLDTDDQNALKSNVTEVARAIREISFTNNKLKAAKEKFTQDLENLVPSQANATPNNDAVVPNAVVPNNDAEANDPILTYTDAETNNTIVTYDGILTYTDAEDLEQSFESGSIIKNESKTIENQTDTAKERLEYAKKEAKEEIKERHPSPYAEEELDVGKGYLENYEERHPKWRKDILKAHMKFFNMDEIQSKKEVDRYDIGSFYETGKSFANKYNIDNTTKLSEAKIRFTKINRNKQLSDDQLFSILVFLTIKQDMIKYDLMKKIDTMENVDEIKKLVKEYTSY